MNKSLYVYRSNRVIKIKDGITLDALKESGYFISIPDTIVCSSVPLKCYNGKVGTNGHCTRY